MAQIERKKQTSISLSAEDLAFARENNMDLSRIAAEQIAVERRKKAVSEAFNSVGDVMEHLMSDKEAIARYVKGKRVW